MQNYTLTQNMPNQLIDKHEQTCHQVIEAFCAKQDLDFEYWVGDAVGEIACFGDVLYFNYSDIVLDLRNNYPKGKIIDWLYHDLEYNQDRLLKDDLVEAVKLLQDLTDLQNGSPLVRYEKEWEQTMADIDTFFGKYHEKGLRKFIKYEAFAIGARHNLV